MRNSYNESMGWGSRIAIALAVLVVVGAIGLAFYGGRVQPVQHPVELIVPNDHLPH